MKVSGKETNMNCDTCILGKMTNQRSRIPDEKAKSPLELIHLDLAGPIDPATDENFRFTLICVDDYSGLVVVYFLKQKSDTAAAFRNFLADMSPFGKVKKVRSDQGGEFISNEFMSILRENLIGHEFSSPNSPHQNGTAERQWRTLFDTARCLLIDAKLQKSLWHYAVLTSAYIRNRCYNRRLRTTPFEAMTGKKPNIAHMHVFGETCFALKQNPKKLDSRSERGIFIGYDRRSPAYLVYFPELNNVKKVRCVRFMSNGITNGIDTDVTSNENDVVIVPNDQSKSADECTEIKSTPETIVRDDGPHTITPNVDIQPVNDNVNEQDQNKPRARFKPKHLDDYFVNDEVDDFLQYTVHYCYNVNNVPKTYNEAITSESSEEWKHAMDVEMNALNENHTFEITTLPPGRNAVGGRWVYTIKSGPDNQNQYKARFVAKGYSQIPNIDFGETFSPTARMTSIRTLMQLAVDNDLFVHQMDVKAAYLNAPIDRELYVEQPEGYETKGPKNEKLVLKLKKSLYGLKQSGRNWNHTLQSYLFTQGFDQSPIDPCVYTLRHSNEHPDDLVIIVIWVDDLLLATKHESTMTRIKDELNRKFQMKDLGIVSWFLGIHFRRDDNSIIMSQARYVERVLEKFSMQNCKPKGTPCDQNVNKLCNSEGNEVDAKLYREMIGSLIYIMISTRPDLSYIVTKLSQYMSKPNSNHMIVAKHVLRYLKSTINQTLIFRKSNESLKLMGFCDADWGNSELDRRSITGYGFQLSVNGPLISWKARKQPTVALSTCEAEYMALAAATQEGKYLLALFSDMSKNINPPKPYELSHFILYCDNQGAIALSNNPVQHQRSKHIDVRYHFIREAIQNGKVQLFYVPSEENIADVFTKPVTRHKNEKFRPLLMG